MFKNGFIVLHLGMILFSAGYYSLFIGITGFIVVEALNWLDSGYWYIAPLAVWLSGILGSVLLFLFVKCPMCGKLLLVVTDINHIQKNKRRASWFLGSIPPVVVCEHCGSAYEGNT